ncbi:MAG: hypothetical protein M2R45_04733 [Verrucomicrobia subdivision 3 bacterium]|nr:hypothetical protein [Limisphaerales bacterium]MCS1415753.1 hypothetical protein [Limisphaerales bacterium]
MEQQKTRNQTILLTVANAIGLNICPLNLSGQSVGVGFVPIDIPQGVSLVSNPLATEANRVQYLIMNAPDGF